MNFYNEDEKKAGIPVIPGAASPFRKTSAFGKAPMFSRAAGSFVDRLKNLSRRDMAFVAIGLSVLVMAPVAEYMISQPSQDNVLKGNDFAQRHGDAGPFEPGINGLSQGSADGSGEVITPLTSRDPASLILGAQSSQPVLPPAVTAPPSSSWRDAVTDSGRAAFSAASKSVGAPTVIPRMASTLRGMSFFGGDNTSRTSGTLSGGKIIDDAKSASSKAAKRSMIGPVAMAGYKGVATGNPNSSSKGAFEKLRGAADKSASNFSGGSAMGSLDKAAADAVQIGAGAGGSGGLGEGDKTKGANNYDNKYKHERSGESLAEAAAKARQQKALEWEFFKKYEIKKTIVNAVVNAFATTLGKFLTSQMEDALGMSSPPPKAKYCWVPAGGYTLVGSAEKPSSADTQACKDKGATKSGVVVLAAGKESSAAGQVLYCPCGYANEPITGKNTDASTSDPAADKPLGDQAAAKQEAFDEIIHNIVTETARVEKDADDAKELAGGLKNIAANFDAFAGQKLASLDPLQKNKQAASAELGVYSGNMDKAQGQYDAIEKKHGAFSGQVDKLNAAIKTSGTGDAATYDCSGVATTGEEGKKAVLAPETCKKIATDIAKWKVTSKDSLDAVRVKMTSHRNSYGEYERQVGFVDKHITNISTMYDGITELYRSAPALDNPETPSLEKAVARLKALTGRPEKEGETLQAGTIALKQATDLRALDWKLVWEKHHKFDNSGAEKNETTAWAAQQANISVGKPTEDTSAEDVISNYMRSSNIISSMKGRYSDLALIEGEVSGIETAMNRFKSDLVAQKVDGASYFPSAKPDNPVNGGNDSGNDSGNGSGNGSGNASGVTNAATARADSVLSDGTQRMALNQPVLDGISSRSDNCTSTECKGRMADARTAMGDMTTKIGEIQELQRKAMQPGANVAQLDAEIQQKQRELHAADTRFDEASKRVAALEGYRPPKPPTQPTADQIAKQQDINKAELHVRAIDACYVGTSGFKAGASARCERELATRTATTVLTARAWRDDVISSTDAAYRATLLGNLANERGTAYGWVSTCLRTIPAGCSK